MISSLHVAAVVLSFPSSTMEHTLWRLSTSVVAASTSDHAATIPTTLLCVFNIGITTTYNLPSTLVLCHSPRHLQVSKSYAKQQPRREQQRPVSAHRRTSA